MKKIILVVLGLVSMSLSGYCQNLAALEEATVAVSSKAGKSVVSISSIVKEKVQQNLYLGSPLEGFGNDPFQRYFEEFFGSFPEQDLERRGLGSGVIIEDEGYILTNEHVVSGATQIKVKLFDGREFDAEIKGVDERSDLAVIKIDTKGLPAAKLGNSDELQIGRWVVAIGNPFGFAIENSEPTITVGVVSALHRYLPALGRRQKGYEDLIQTDAAINPGNSGGPLVNLRGEVIGINTAIITTTGGYQGLGFAIPINKAKKVLAKLLKGEKVLYGWLGVSIQDLNEDLRNYFGVKERKGVISLKVYKDSPAEKAGIKEGDLILAFNNQQVKTTHDLIRMVSASEVGQRIPIDIIRSGKKNTFTIKIGEMPKDFEEIETSDDNQGFSFRGLKVDDLSAAYKNRYRIKLGKGVVIVEVEKGASAEKSGLRAGDVITKIENKKIDNKEDFKAATSTIKGNCLLKTNRGYFVLKNSE